MTGTSTGIYGRNNVLGDFGRWLGRTIFDVTH